MPGSAADRRRAVKSRVGLVAAEAGGADAVVRAGKAAVAATAAPLVTVAVAVVLLVLAKPKLSKEHLAAVERMAALWEASPRAAVHGPRSLPEMHSPLPLSPASAPAWLLR